MKKINKKQLMQLAWQFCRQTGDMFAECLKMAWRNMKLVAEMHVSIVKFKYKKIDGSIRDAWGSLVGFENTMRTDRRAKNDTVQVYYDILCEDFRCFKKLNLLAQ